MVARVLLIKPMNYIAVNVYPLSVWLITYSIYHETLAFAYVNTLFIQIQINPYGAACLRAVLTL